MMPKLHVKHVEFSGFRGVVDEYSGLLGYDAV
jgi:hypothetical protein